MTPITVIKLDFAGEEVWRYQGVLIERGLHHILLEAYFDRHNTDLGGLLLAKGDRFLEIYYDDRWYNVFQIHDRGDDHLKGWYANIGMPARFEDQTLSYRDLALDLLVLPDGHQVILDEEEFTTLPLSDAVREAALIALRELQHRFKREVNDIALWEAG